MSPNVKAFLATVAGLATKLGTPVLIVVRDPADRAVHFVGTPGALENMKVEITKKVLGPKADDDEAVTGWE